MLAWTGFWTASTVQGAEDLGALMFGYRFERYGLGALPYPLGWR
jgi:hypothetical protein